MPRQVSAYARVRDTLKAICAEHPNNWPTVQQVAEKAGVSPTTARRHLEANRGYIGYRSQMRWGVAAYRYDEPDYSKDTSNIALAVAFLFPGQY